MFEPAYIYKFPNSDTVYYDDYNGLYKIDTYVNNELVNSKLNEYNVYICPISFNSGDVVEIRIYKNQGTKSDPIWSERYYVLNNITITNSDLNHQLTSNSIIFEVIDAYINNEEYINLHPGRMSWDSDSTQMSNVTKGTVLTNIQNFIVYSTSWSNPYIPETDITNYATTVNTVLKNENYEVLPYSIIYDLTEHQFIYDSDDPLPVGIYYMDIEVIDTIDGRNIGANAGLEIIELE